MARLNIQTFVPGEIYHVYNRGAHKADVFKNESDYVRMQGLMYLCNSDRKVVMRDILKRGNGDQFAFFDEELLHEYVDVLAYCLMKNHVHFVLRPKIEGGLEKFMLKTMTGFSMYANTKYGHSGTMWEGRFKAKHVATDAYLWQLFAYVHVNPVEYVTSFWKEDRTVDVPAAVSFLYNFPQSSLVDFYIGERPQTGILTRDDAYTGWIRNFPLAQNLVEYYLRQDFTELELK
jgi:putative transposase